MKELYSIKLIMNQEVLQRKCPSTLLYILPVIYYYSYKKNISAFQLAPDPVEVAFFLEDLADVEEADDAVDDAVDEVDSSSMPDSSSPAVRTLLDDESPHSLL